MPTATDDQKPTTNPTGQDQNANGPDNSSTTNVFGLSGNPFSIEGGLLGNGGEQNQEEQDPQQGGDEKDLKDHYDDAKDIHKKLKGEKDVDESGPDASEPEEAIDGQKPKEAPEGPEKAAPSDGEAGTETPQSEGQQQSGNSGKIGENTLGEAEPTTPETTGIENGNSGQSPTGPTENYGGGNSATSGPSGNTPVKGGATTGAGATTGSPGAGVGIGGNGVSGAAAGNAASPGLSATSMAGAAGNPAIAANAGGAALATGTGTVGVEGVALTAGAAGSGATAGLSLAIAAAIALAMKYKDQLIEGAKTGGKAIIGLIIMLTIMASAAVGQPGLGALNGSGGKTNQVAAGPGESDISAVLAAANQQAKSRSSNVAGGGEKAGSLLPGSGYSINKFKRVAFSDRDSTFLKNVFAKGVDPKKNSAVDVRVLDALIYLSNRHSYINVSNIVFKYENMPIDAENSSSSQVIANISAHVSGQAADIREIDFVYKAMDPISCTKDPKDPRRDWVWYNDKNEELLRQSCKGNIFSPFRGGPIIKGKMTQAFPIKIIWQDDAPKKSGNMTGTARGNAESALEKAFKLPAGSLDRSNGLNSLQQIGFAEIAQQIGVNPAMVSGSTPNELFQNIGLGNLEDQLGLSSGSLGGSTLSRIVKQTGQSTLEEFFNLPVGSWKGVDLKSTIASIGQGTIEKEFGLPTGVLENPISAQAYFSQEAWTSIDTAKVAQALNLPQDQISTVVNQISNGTINADTFKAIGSKRLERSFELDDGALDPYISQNGNGITPGMVLDDLATKVNLTSILDNNDVKKYIDPTRLTSILTNLGKGENFQNEILQLGGSKLDNSFALAPGTTNSFVSSGDGDPLDQIDLIRDGSLKNAGIALFKGQFKDYALDYGKNFIDTKLISGPRNMSVFIENKIKSMISQNPLKAAEQIGSQVLNRNLEISPMDGDKFKGGDIKNIPAISNTLVDSFKWTDDDINALTNKSLTSLPSVVQKISGKFNLSTNDYTKFIQGDVAQMDIISDEAAKRTGLTKNDIVQVVAKNLKNSPFVKNILSNTLRWPSSKINAAANSEIVKIPEVQGKLGGALKFSTDDWNKYLSSDILSTGLFSSISQDKLNCSTEDIGKLQNGQAKDIAAIRNPIKGMKLSSGDLSLLKQGDIKSMPSVRTALQTAFKMSGDDVAKLFNGNITGISKINSALASQFKIPQDDVAKLLSGDFKNVQSARDILTSKLPINDNDLNLIADGNFGQISVVKNELKGMLGVSDDEVSGLLNGSYKDSAFLQQVAMNKIGLSGVDIKSVLSGDTNAITKLGNSLVSSGRLNASEAGLLTAGNWLGAGKVQAEVGRLLKTDVLDIEAISKGGLKDLALIRNIASDKFNLNSAGLDQLTSGNWGAIKTFQDGLGQKYNLNSSSISNLVSGNIPNISNVSSLMSSQFGIPKLDLQNITGQIDFANFGSFADLGQGFDMTGGALGSILGGTGGTGAMAGLGSLMNGGGFGFLGGGEAEVMKKVYRPEARRKVHQVLDELLDMPTVLKNLNFKVTQLITFNQQRDVDPFEPKMEPLYGKSIKNGGSRAENYGLFSMPEAHPNLHIGY